MDSKKHSKYLLVLYFICLISLSGIAQGFGFSFSYSNVDVIGMDIFYGDRGHRFHLGFGYQSNGQKNKVVTERGSNYGLTKIGEGDFIITANLGYSKLFFDKLSVYSELNIGTKKYFTNYRDNRFSDNGYSLIDDTDAKTGVGISIGYIFKSIVEPFIGFSTLTKFNFGLRLTLNFKALQRQPEDSQSGSRSID